MPDSGPGTIEQALEKVAGQLVFLTPAERAGRWRQLFGDGAARVPQPYWLFSDADQEPLVLGFPLRVSAEWETFGREVGHLIDAEIAYRRAMAQQEAVSKAALVDQRRAMVAKLTDTLENAYLHDYGQRLPEVLLLAFTREASERLRAASRALAVAARQIAPRVIDEIRYATAQRLADVTHRARTQALDRLRRADALVPTAASRVFADLLRDDLLPFAEVRFGPDLRELTSFLQGSLHLDAARFRALFQTTSEQLQALRAQDPAFDRVLTAMDPEAPTLAADRQLFSTAVLDLLEVWPNPATPRLSADLRRLLIDLAQRCKRLEVIGTLRDRLVPVEEHGFRTVAQIHGQVVQLSGSTRPLDFTAPGVLSSVVRRYGLLYDLVEFTQLIEELRRRGRSSEEQAMRRMVEFLAALDGIQVRNRLKFEKFLGDGAFYSARNARSVFQAAAELRLLYEDLRQHGFPFDRGLRLAINVGTYHLLPMMSSSVDRPHFEFFGHGLVELVRLTTGKTTHDVEDITDFLVASGYDLQRVLEFLEPVRHGKRFADVVAGRPYAAFIAENGELVNLGGVLTESFLQDFESERGDRPLAEADAYGTRWLMVATAPAGEPGPWVALRFLGTARLKGLDPTPLVETMVFDQLPPGAVAIAPASRLQPTLLRLAGADREPADAQETTPADVDKRLCVVSVLEDEATRTWYIGRFEDEVEALLNAFRVKLAPVGLKDGEPFESWLFQRRGDLAMLYQGLRRHSSGATVPLEDLRRRDGYFTCLLAAPHRSPR
jgi:hypothetical protein